MDTAFLQELLGEPIRTATPLRGGDIASAFKVTGASNTYFVKTASFSNAMQLFEAETIGLQLLGNTKAISVPKVVSVSHSDATAYLVLEYIASKTPEKKDLELLGVALAGLHSVVSEPMFGFPTDNYIGRLVQRNTSHDNWIDFYINERILPQLQMAINANLYPGEALPDSGQMERVCSSLFGDITPSLLHGDLWSGNYLISTEGRPYLIDPAVYYGHNEMDLAMTKLFGGFSSSFYGAYHDVIPPHPNQKELTELYQLYYLLVHLNLFGTSYLPGVQGILTKYFG